MILLTSQRERMRGIRAWSAAWSRGLAVRQAMLFP